MAIFSVLLDNPDQEIWNTIKRKWPKAHFHNDYVAFLSDGGDQLTAKIHEKAGIGPEHSGIVVQVNYYSGFTDPVLVEWLQKNV